MIFTSFNFPHTLVRVPWVLKVGSKSTFAHIFFIFVQSPGREAVASRALTCLRIRLGRVTKRREQLTKRESCMHTAIFIISHCISGSVGRALDGESEGRGFDPSQGNNFLFFLHLIFSKRSAVRPKVDYPSSFRSQVTKVPQARGG